MSQGSFTGSEQISEEANGDVLSFINNSDLGSDLDLYSLFDGDASFSDFPIAGTCDLPIFAEVAPNCTEPNEFDGYLGPLYSDNSIEYDQQRALINCSLPQLSKRKSSCSTNPIELSQSVGVGQPQNGSKTPRKIDIVYPLEEFFRPRYKSDYFAQNGKSRKPRYVADRHGNHFITLKVPVGVSGKIRIDWLTVPDQNGDRYSMPYRFQQSNDSASIRDENPIYVNINPDKNGQMKLYLVLIKSKQDELKTLQPLRPFCPFKDALAGLAEEKPKSPAYILTPKQLIQTYQLDRSQLAFTFCSSTPEWDTTVYSTVMTEMAPETGKKDITCPRCQHIFPITVNGGNVEQEIVKYVPLPKRKVESMGDEQIITRKRNTFQFTA